MRIAHGKALLMCVNIVNFCMGKVYICSSTAKSKLSPHELNIKAHDS